MLQYYSARCSSTIERLMKRIEEQTTEDVLMEFSKANKFEKGGDIT